MTAPRNAPAFDIDIAIAASQRWHEGEGERERKHEALRHGRLTEVESPSRLAKRVNRLVGKVRQALPEGAEAMMPKMLADLSVGPALSEDDIDDVLAERVINETRDFLAIQFLEGGMFASRAVGRIVTNLGGGRVGYGTGFMVSPTLLMTNHHVLPDEETAAISSIEFDYQLDRRGQALTYRTFRLRPERFFVASESLDFAVVAVGDADGDAQGLARYGFLPLIGSEGKISIGEPVNVVQHPLGEMKQIVIRDNRLCDFPSQSKLNWIAQYTADTERGSSGSPVFNDQWEVVALHHSGVAKTDADGNMLRKDGGIWRKGDDPEAICWIANEGIRISRLVNHLRTAEISGSEPRLRDELLGAPGSNADGDGHLRGSHEIVRVDPASGASVSIPLTVTVTIGGTRHNAMVQLAAQAGQPVSTEEAIRPELNYDARPGYDPMFLGLNVPMPRLSNSIASLAARLDGTAETELKYHHFSVIMNAKRKLAFVSAVNYDGRAGEQARRDKGGDRWFFDPRLRQSVQAGGALYADNPLDRGHLTRRADAAWGETADEAKRANDDTFHWTNCSPQHEIFNQPTKAADEGVRLWGNLEEHVAKQAQAEGQRFSIFNGPIFREDDKSYRDIRLPREFYKIIAYRADDGDLRAVGFILSQASLIRSLPEEAFEVGPYKPYQVRIRDIEAATKLDFGPLRGADPMEANVPQEAFVEGADAIEISDPVDIVLDMPRQAEDQERFPGKSFDDLLRAATAEAATVETMRAERERPLGPDAEDVGVKERIVRARVSKRKISPRAIDLIIGFEVSSRKAYEKLYQRPIWPKGASGVTIGIGYDIGYVTADGLREDWLGLIPDAAIHELTRACGVTGPAARDLLPSLKSITVPWTAAEQNFRERVLPRYIGETEAALPNTSLLSDDCMGALVSLDYNRGPSFTVPATKDRTGRYREMRAIRAHMEAKDFGRIPTEIRAMKRLWQGKPDMAGLLKRRELEAALFEQGLARPIV